MGQLRSVLLCYSHCKHTTFSLGRDFSPKEKEMGVTTQPQHKRSLKSQEVG